MSDDPKNDEAQSSAPVRVVGIPFPKGKSGNPGGRKKEAIAYEKEVIALGRYAVPKLKRAIRKGEPWALKIWADVSLRPAAKRVELSGEDGQPINLNLVPQDKLNKLEEAIRDAVDAAGVAAVH